MKLFVSSFIGLMLCASVAAEPLLEGRVRLESGQPAAGAQVQLFDLTGLRRLGSATADEAGHFALPLRALSAVTGTALPTHFALGQNYPNPFNPSTIIPYQLPTAGHVRLDVFNILGQRLATLVDGERSAGAHTAQWDGTGVSGRAVGAGVYIYRLSSGGASASRRMVLVDGQAGIPMAGTAPDRMELVAPQPQAAGRVLGLTVSGQGLVAYVDPSFRMGIDTASIVVESYEGAARLKRAAGGVLGDVNNDGQVDLSDVLFVLLYSADSSIVLPNNGNISLGDVNEDGRVDSADAVLLIRFLSDPFDPTLPLKLGRTEVSLGSSIADSLPTGAVAQFFIEMSSSGALVVYTTGSTDTYASILDGSGNVLASDDDGGEGLNFLISTSVQAGPYYIAVRAYGSGDYTLHVRTNDPDLVVASSVNDSTLAYEQPFTLRATVRNQGGGEPEPTVLFYYSSTDATITSDDTQISADVVSIDTDIVTKSLSLTAPAEAGTYYYGACVQSVSGEHNTDNNCSDAVRVSVSSDFAYTPPITSETVGLYDTLVSTFINIFFAALIPGTTSVAGEGGGSVEISGNDWTLQDYSPDGELIANGALSVGLDQTPIPLSGEVILSGSYEAELVLDMQLSVGTDGLSATGTITINGAEFDVAEVSAAASTTFSRIYWTEWGFEPKIQRANLDGSNIETLVTGLDTPRGIALDVAEGKMYWTDYDLFGDGDTGKVQRANLDGSNIETLVTGSDGLGSIALDAAEGKMYWMSYDGIQRANLDGSNIETLVTGLGGPKGIALDVAEGKMYWMSYDGIQRANLDGSNIENIITGLDGPAGIALDVAGGKMYWADEDWASDTGKIQRANLDGSNIENIITGLDSPEGIALYLVDDKLYWTEHFGTYEGINRANLDGSNIETLITGLNLPGGIALGP